MNVLGIFLIVIALVFGVAHSKHEALPLIEALQTDDKPVPLFLFLGSLVVYAGASTIMDVEQFLWFTIVLCLGAWFAQEKSKNAT